MVIAPGFILKCEECLKEEKNSIIDKEITNEVNIDFKKEQSGLN